MNALFWISLLLLPFLVKGDPAPGVFRSKDRSRELECERVTTEAGSERYPGVIETARPRGDFVERSAVICTERLMRPGLRAPRDEAILLALEAEAMELALSATSLRPEHAGRTWLVETFYENVQVSDKISFATKNALAGQGLRVSDRRPRLGVGDIDVITRMEPEQAYPAACRRFADNGSLLEGDALLAVVSRDPRETTLHAGLCIGGQWQWLR